MKQLTGIDATFLYMETPTTFGHVSGLLIFERPTPDFDPFATVYQAYGDMVGEIEPMRRRLVEVPFGLDHPYWVDDPQFDLSYHVRALNLAPPGLADQLCEQVARIHGRPMDRTRPLWEVYVIDGLGDGRWAIMSKTHHATIDGASGQIMLEMLLSPNRDDPPKGQNLPWPPGVIPTPPELMRKAIDNLVRNPIKSFGVQMRIVRQLAGSLGLDSVGSAAEQAAKAVKRLAGRREDDGRPRVSLPTTRAPSTPFNKTITPHRRFAIRSASLSNVKRLKDATGGTLNDVVMAICAGGLRTYLQRHDALPDQPLRAMVPVSIRTGNEADPWTNRVSSMVAELPTDEPDPLERVRKSHEAMLEAKRLFQLVPAEALVDITQFSSPVLATAAIRLSSQLGMSERIYSLPFNLTVSNVPGPRVPLYFAGAQLVHQFPVSIVTDGQGLNITVQSYLDSLDFGLIADRELVPDLWDLIDDLVDEISVLFEATGAEWAVPPHDAYPRQGVPGGGTGRAGGRKATARKAPARKAPARKRAASSGTARSAAKKSTAKKASTKKAAPRKTAAKKSTSGG